MNPTNPKNTKNSATESPALLIIDMVKDNFKEERNLPITPLALKTIEPLNQFIRFFRSHAWPVIFSTDAFNKNDFIFTGRMPPHSLAGTEGAEVMDALDFQETDTWLPKPRFSAFFKTGLEEMLHDQKVTLCAVAGIATPFCVLTTAMDALCHDFKAVILENCSTAFSDELHRQTLDIYRRNPLYPLFRIMTSTELMHELRPVNSTFGVQETRNE
jgi:nicotinamidase-related amidase